MNPDPRRIQQLTVRLESGIHDADETLASLERTKDAIMDTLVTSRTLVALQNELHLAKESANVLSRARFIAKQVVALVDELELLSSQDL